MTYIKTTNQNGKAIKDIGLTWQKLFIEGIYEKIPNKVNNKTIGLYREYEGDYSRDLKYNSYFLYEL